ncbi:hypothetical protein P152DRAFT_459221 [Eremomyces bilateralis CBS 781.70]|uniref:FAD-binding FR-type domain-containing protein n=1 Tax=Eremomyces bilateralis CBS 781.70 TaxID=1392243 RepID=A0A6G1G1E8_9PEZI|nr:uncharacterized protein P152DRAFT_459221 [Eremomyces bilateralis CBS 781.70]KAF1811756.1 hypothetical protein P152DRAFT_459221 [Eremomyces bilateralis CBS 781.70]
MPPSSFVIPRSIGSHGDLVPDFITNSSGDSLVQYTTGLSGVQQETNYIFVHALLFALLAAFGFILIYRGAILFERHVRHINTVGGVTQQALWAHNGSTAWSDSWVFIKRHILYAPLGKKRHNQEIKISKAHAIGTLPSRFHTMMLLTWLFANIAFCLVLPWSTFPSQEVVAALRGRSGVLAALNLFPTILFALRNNPLIWLLSVSYDTFNLLHRWCGRVVVLQSLIHVLCWSVNTIAATTDDFNMGVSLSQHLSYRWGLVGAVGFTLIAIFSIGPLRHAFYDSFVHGHRLIVLISLVGVYVHLQTHKLPQLWWLQVVCWLWGMEWLFRSGRIMYYSFTFGQMSKVTVEALPGEACRLSIDVVRPFRAAPGSNVHIYIPRFNPHLMSHPFSVAWTDCELPKASAFEFSHMSSAPAANYNEKRGPSSTDQNQPTHTTSDIALFNPPSTRVHLICKAREGLTKQLYQRAAARPDKTLTTRCLLEGPYGGMDPMSSYGTVVLFAGGIGITHMLPHLRHLVHGYHLGVVSTRKVLLVWSMPDQNCFDWVRPYMNQVLEMPGRREILKMEIYITRGNGRETSSQSGGVRTFTRRCDPNEVIDRMMQEPIGATCVTVCGPGVFADDVRAAARKRVGKGCLDFVEEAFSY